MLFMFAKAHLVAIAPLLIVKKVKFDFKGYRGAFIFHLSIILFIG